MVVPRKNRMTIMNPLYSQGPIWDQQEIIDATEFAEPLLAKGRWRRALDTFDIYLALLDITERTLVILIPPQAHGNERNPFVYTDNIAQVMFSPEASQEVLLLSADQKIDKEFVSSAVYHQIHDFIRNDILDPEIRKSLSEIGELTKKQIAFFASLAGAGLLAKKEKRRRAVIATSLLSLGLLLIYKASKKSKRNNTLSMYDSFVSLYRPRLESIASRLRTGQISLIHRTSALFSILRHGISSLGSNGEENNPDVSIELPRDYYGVPRTPEIRALIAMLLENTRGGFLSGTVRKFYLHQMWKCISTYPLYGRYEPFLRWIEKSTNHRQHL